MALFDLELSVTVMEILCMVKQLLADFVLAAKIAKSYSKHEWVPP